MEPAKKKKEPLFSKSGLKFQRTSKVQRKISFTPKPLSTFYSLNNDTNIISFDQVLANNNDINNKMIELNLGDSEASQKKNRQSSPFKTGRSPGDRFQLFDEKFKDIVQSIKSISKKKDEDHEEREEEQLSLSNDISEDCESTPEESEEEEIKMKNLTNIQEISDFYEYTEECMKLISQIKITEESTLKERYVSLPFKNNIGTEKGQKRLAIFDLDETLVHCEINEIAKAHTTLQVALPGNKTKTIGLNIRPHWKEELIRIKKKYYIIIYTASHHSYADTVLNYLDPDNSIFDYRLYRSNCTMVEVDGKTFYIKDLRIFEDVSLSDMVIIDNSVLSFAFHLNNGIPILPYYKGNEESELHDLCELLLKLCEYPDFQTQLSSLMNLDSYLKKKPKKISTK